MGRHKLGNVVYAKRVTKRIAGLLDEVRGREQGLDGKVAGRGLKGQESTLKEPSTAGSKSGVSCGADSGALEVGEVGLLAKVTASMEFEYKRAEELREKVEMFEKRREAWLRATGDQQACYWRDRAIKAEAALRAGGDGSSEPA